MQYCLDIFNRSRLITRKVAVGNVEMGGGEPVVVQSMTTTDTMDTEKSIEQSVRMIDAGCEVIRLTAPSKKEAENLRAIRDGLRKMGYNTPLVADIHFTPNAAEIAANIVEKVRINPGNFVDKKRFEELVYDANSYQAELDKIEQKLIPLIHLCKTNNVVLRIGTNHGSLSDRILSTFGDTPEGMVESALEFVRICEKHGFYNIVLSMKASNTRVMVQAYRLLSFKMLENNHIYPIHLGVTEAGEGEDGRVKSAVGIGALLEDGIGDTIRVSLTEEPEEEIPVAKNLIQKFQFVSNMINETLELTYNPFEYNKKHSKHILNLGGDHPPIVMGSLNHYDQITPANLFSLGYRYSAELDKWHLFDQACDFIYIGDKKLNFEVPDGIILVTNFGSGHDSMKTNFVNLVRLSDLKKISPDETFIIELSDVKEITHISKYQNAILLFEGSVQEQRLLRIKMDVAGMKNPIILKYTAKMEEEKEQLWASSQLGPSFIDGFGDGIFIDGSLSNQSKTSLSFGILQATRCRISKTEYISCPSCGRTLFDLQETTAKIRKETEHLKGVKIGIMGCIVNGPGEMADADFGYVGSGPGKIHLYKEKEIMKKNVPTENAVDELISLIKEHGMWVEKH